MENTIFIGQKETATYIMAIQTLINKGLQKIIIKSRGRAISKAVDTVERAKRTVSKELTVKDIIISSETINNKSEGSGDPYTTNISAMDIILEIKEK